MSAVVHSARSLGSGLEVTGSIGPLAMMTVIGEGRSPEEFVDWPGASASP